MKLFGVPVALGSGGLQAPTSEPQPALVPKAVEMPDPPTPMVNPKKKPGLPGWGRRIPTDAAYAAQAALTASDTQA